MQAENPIFIITGNNNGLKKSYVKILCKDPKTIAAKIFLPSAPLVMNFLIKKYVDSLSEEAIIDGISTALDLDETLVSLSTKKAKNTFEFAVGREPKNGGIYIRHPIFPIRYIAPEDFSRTLSKEKEAAFLQIASSLGAKTVKITNVTNNSQKGMFAAKVPVKKIAGEVGIKASFDSNGELKEGVYMSFDKPQFEMNVSENLQKWVDWSPELRTMVHARLKNRNLKNMKVNLEFKEGMVKEEFNIIFPPSLFYQFHRPKPQQLAR